MFTVKNHILCIVYQFVMAWTLTGLRQPQVNYTLQIAYRANSARSWLSARLPLLYSDEAFLSMFSVRWPVAEVTECSLFVVVFLLWLSLVDCEVLLVIGPRFGSRERPYLCKESLTEFCMYGYISLVLFAIRSRMSGRSLQLFSSFEWIVSHVVL